jgi:hypothetical protein
VMVIVAGGGSGGHAHGLVVAVVVAMIAVPRGWRLSFWTAPV